MSTFEIVKYLAEKNHLSLTEVNDKAGLGTGSIYNWKTKVPSINNLKKVAKVLHTTPGYLLGDDPTATKISNAEKNLLDSFSDLTTDMSEEEKENFSKSLTKMAVVMKDYLQKERGTEKGEKIL
jgi:transcriptional regulator with XRE-family HTH domain